MTRTLEAAPVQERRSRTRMLKPVVEKKRRDRINKSLAQLRTLLLSSTLDPRLQNPKLEKAEILDLAVEHLHKWTEGRASSPAGGLQRPEPPPLQSMESAGFQQCVAQMMGYMNKISPTQRSSLLDGLRSHVESLQSSGAGPDLSPSLDLISTSESKDRSLVLPHSPLMCSTPCHDSLTPPTSPWFSTFSPPFPSFACHFSFPPSLSPHSSNASFSTLPAHSHPAPSSDTVVASSTFPSILGTAGLVDSEFRKRKRETETEKCLGPALDCGRKPAHRKDRKGRYHIDPESCLSASGFYAAISLPMTMNNESLFRDPLTCFFPRVPAEVKYG
ncbi:transcription factor HES-7-like [Synchiropus splendidus]|uniref:transcription factor HES-7-like n=1 Tax=Synchiropus splendidus TaxID=270530 RepID=UPI00237E0B77|nr:transcription factor HES-7-like [Synchiropus splendidus]